MHRADVVVARLAAGQNGVLSTRQFRSADVASSTAGDRLRSGVLVRVHRGVYRHAAAPGTWLSGLTGAVLAAGDGAVTSHRSAAVLHGLEGVRPGAPEVTVPTLDLPRIQGVRLHRTTLLESIDVVMTSGVAATAVPRTLLDLGAVAPYEVVARAAEDAIIRRLTTTDALVGVLERVGGRGRRGTARLRAWLRTSVVDDRLESELERLLLELLRRSPLPEPSLQHRLTCADGRRVRLDAAYPELLLAVEADGHRWHGTSAAFRRDLERSRSIQSSGWTHLRYGWSDLRDRPDLALDELCRVASRYRHNATKNEVVRSTPVGSGGGGGCW